jgi:N-acetylglucosamine kinase-like BadF-type ATPase
MSYFLAIDAGGTKADYLLADEHRQLARVRSGTIKRMRSDEATCAANLSAALAELTQHSGVSIGEVACTCIGTAGQSVPLVSDWLREALGARVGGKLILLGDIEIALDAAFPGQPGVVVIAGTGSNVAGRDTAGRLTTAGGWGPALGEQGSGYRIGNEALRAVCLALDEGRPTTLLQAILDSWQLNGVNQLVEYANRLPAPDVTRLTETVLACALAGDAVAAEVLQREGEALGYLVRLVMRRLRLASDNAAWTPPVAFTGSILERVAPVRAALVAEVRSEFAAVEIADDVIDPIQGALWRARRGA